MSEESRVHISIPLPGGYPVTIATSPDNDLLLANGHIVTTKELRAAGKLLCAAADTIEAHCEHVEEKRNTDWMREHLTREAKNAGTAKAAETPDPESD